MRIKIKYPRTETGFKNALQHKDIINKEYNSYTQPFPQAEILVLNNIINLWYNK